MSATEFGGSYFHNVAGQLIQLSQMNPVVPYARELQFQHDKLIALLIQCSDANITHLPVFASNIQEDILNLLEAHIAIEQLALANYCDSEISKTYAIYCRNFTDRASALARTIRQNDAAVDGGVLKQLNELVNDHIQHSAHEAIFANIR